MGHSMGGHGALTIGLRNPDTYAAISAFAPISNPSTVRIIPLSCGRLSVLCQCCDHQTFWLHIPRFRMEEINADAGNPLTLAQGAEVSRGLLHTSRRYVLMFSKHWQTLEGG